LGSVRDVVDNTVTQLQSQLYSPFGEPYGGSGTSQTVFGFTGEPTDANGLVQLRARYYNPALGVFTGLDPLELGNRYQYVRNNPIRWRDPSGLQCTATYEAETPDLECELGGASAGDYGADYPVYWGNVDPNIPPQNIPPYEVPRDPGIGGGVSLPPQDQPYREPGYQPSTSASTGSKTVPSTAAPTSQPQPASQQPDPATRVNDECRQGDCDFDLLPEAAAVRYAHVARSYYERIRTIIRGNPNAAVAASRVRVSSGKCVEVVTMNSVYGPKTKEGIQQSQRTAQGILMILAMGRGALFYTPPLQVEDLSNMSSGQPIRGHAESNLVEMIYKLGPLAINSFRAMGVSQEPCLYGDIGCRTWLPSLVVNDRRIAVAYYLWKDKEFKTLP
jgi:RHS repeat-associated protein